MFTAIMVDNKIAMDLESPKLQIPGIFFFFFFSFQSQGYKIEGSTSVLLYDVCDKL